MQNEGRRPLKGELFTQPSEGHQIWKRRFGKGWQNQASQISHPQPPEPNVQMNYRIVLYLWFRYGKANGESQCRKAERLFKAPLTLLCTGRRKEGADFQGRGLAGNDLPWFPTFSAGEVGSAIQRFSIATLQRSCCSDLRCQEKDSFHSAIVPSMRCCILQQEGLLQLAAGATACSVAHERGSQCLITILVDYQEHTKHRSFHTSAIFKPTKPTKRRKTGSR